MYQGLRNLSTKLITQFGSPCVIYQSVDGEYNIETGELEYDYPVHKNAHCLFDNLAYDFPSFSSQGVSSSSSNMIQTGDVVVYVTVEASPELQSVIECNGEKWQVTACQPIKPADTALLFQCRARKVTNGTV